jgi:Xaa-Pro dipeptidase
MTQVQHREIMGLPIPFGDAEYGERIDAARRQLQEASLDAIVLFHQESMFYLFGYDQLGYWIYQAAIVTADSRDVTVIARPLDADLVEGLPFVGEIRSWRDDSHDDPARMTCEALRDLGVLGAGRRIGIELHSHALLPYYYRGLERGLDGECELVDASDLVTDLRLHKSEGEVSYSRAAGRYMDAGFRAAFAALRPGVTEAQVLGECLNGMLHAGGDVPAVMPPLGSGPRTLGKTHCTASQRVIQDDELFVLEVGGCSQRYHAVGVQSKWMGTPPPEVSERHAALVEAMEAGMAATAPGVPTADVARSVSAVLGARGIPSPGKHFGYGTGIGFNPTWVDNLRIKETDPHVLDPGMVFHLFVYHQLAHPSGPIELFVGRPVLVTETGSEALTDIPLTLDLHA